jgi:hypothetical protein
MPDAPDPPARHTPRQRMVFSAAKRIDRFVAGLARPTPGALFEAMASQWRDEFRSAGFAAGCPVAASAVDRAASAPTVRQAATDAFATWRGAVAAALCGMRVPRGRAEWLATLMISALEGAILMARAEHDVRPLDVVVTQLRPLLDVAPRRPRPNARGRPGPDGD